MKFKTRGRPSGNNATLKNTGKHITRIHKELLYGYKKTVCNKPGAWLNSLLADIISDNGLLPDGAMTYEPMRCHCQLEEQSSGEFQLKWKQISIHLMPANWRPLFLGHNVLKGILHMLLPIDFPLTAL